jgi:hypothetical protein
MNMPNTLSTRRMPTTHSSHECQLRSRFSRCWRQQWGVLRPSKLGPPSRPPVRRCWIWGEYQADSLKKHLYGIAADAGGANSDRYKHTSDEQKVIQAEVKKQATEDEAARDGKLAEGRIHEQRHHRLAVAATLAEIGIAICTVAIITRRKPFWLGSLVLGLTSILVLGYSYLS